MLALEEPETHLHPQATRSLCAGILSLSGQKLITTHSPFFVQHVPFQDLRLVQMTATGTKVSWLPRAFSASVPHVPALDEAVKKRHNLLEYESTTELLTVKGVLDDTTYRELLTCFPDRQEVQVALKELKARSIEYVSDQELADLETWARRIRGEIFFARQWLLVEGQCEYLLLHALGDAMGYDLDRNGIAVIDFQNNGAPAPFAALARALDIPWLALIDGDNRGKQFVAAIQARGSLRAGRHDRQGTLVERHHHHLLRAWRRAVGRPEPGLRRDLRQHGLRVRVPDREIGSACHSLGRLHSCLGLARKMSRL